MRRDEPADIPAMRQGEPADPPPPPRGRAQRIGLRILQALLLCLAVLWVLAPVPVPQAPEPRALKPLPPGTGPLRIVVLGTSLTERARWPQELGRALSACSGREVAVLPVAKGGAGSEWGRGQVDRVVAAAPDLVLIEFSINDADLCDGVSLARARDNHSAILDALAAARPSAQPVLMTMSPAFGLRGWLRPWRSDHEAQYRQMAAERDIGLIDLVPVWTRALAEAPAGPRDLMPDGLHPRPEAVTAVALPLMRLQIGAVLPGCELGG